MCSRGPASHRVEIEKVFAFSSLTSSLKHEGEEFPRRHSKPSRYLSTRPPGCRLGRKEGKSTKRIFKNPQARGFKDSFWASSNAICHTHTKISEGNFLIKIICRFEKTRTLQKCPPPASEMAHHFKNVVPNWANLLTQAGWH